MTTNQRLHDYGREALHQHRQAQVSDRHTIATPAPSGNLLEWLIQHIPDILQWGTPLYWFFAMFWPASEHLQAADQYALDSAVFAGMGAVLCWATWIAATDGEVLTAFLFSSDVLLMAGMWF